MTAGAAEPAARPRVRRRELRIEPERLYWAVLPAQAWMRGAESMRYELESWIPAPAESFEARFARHAPSGGVVACGADKAELAGWIDARERGGDEVESARAQRLPPAVLDALGVGDDPAEAVRLLAALELRNGAFESPRRRRRRGRIAAALAVAAALSAALWCAGALREASHLQNRASLFESAAVALAEHALGGSSGPVDARLALGAELRRIRQSRDAAAAPLRAADRSPLWAALLLAWPAEFPAQADLIEIDQTSVVVRGSVRDASDFERLRAALEQMNPAWGVHSADITRQREGVAFAVVLRLLDEPVKEAAP